MAEETELNLDEELEELETRLERLRALYEQYFLGIEKLEPQVPRKDVERRIWVLRRVKFRNTAKRFKFNVLTQRFNTFAQYWARICRDIENGTYKRHMLKAEKAFGEPLTIAAKRARGGFSRKAEEEAPPIEPTVEPAADSLDAMLGLKAGRTTAQPATSPGVPAQPTQRPAGAGQKPARFQLERLDLDIDDLIGGGAPPISKRAQAPVGPVRSKPVAEAPPAVEPPPLSGPPVSRPGGGKAPPPVGPMVGARPRMPKGIVPPTESPPAAIQPPPPSVKPQPPPVPARAGKAAPPPLPPRSIPPAAPKPGPPGPSAAPKPPPATGPVAARPAPPPAPKPPVQARPPAGSGAGLSDERLKEIHSRLVDAKRQTNDGKAVTLDGLSKQLRAAEDNLRKQHGNRKIDFDVVIKDGKAVVKPIVK